MGRKRRQANLPQIVCEPRGPRTQSCVSHLLKSSESRESFEMKRYYLVKYVINFSGRLQSITATQISTLDLLQSEKDIEKRL